MTADPKPYRLFATTLDERGRQHSEGAYRFASFPAALEWVRTQQARRTILDVTIYDESDNVVAEASVTS